jgi:hypothetical protein
MLVGFRCPANGELPGRDNDFGYCLTKCSMRCMPKAVLVKLRDQNVTNVHQGEMITPSALKGCTRRLVLERTVPYYQEPEKLYYAVRGSLIHGFLEDHGLPNVRTEDRLFKRIEVNGKPIIFSGQIDYYEGDPEFAIEDYKTLSDKGTYFLFNEGAKPEHVLQTNVYRWLCQGGRLGSIDGPEVNWPVNRITISYLFMNRVVMTGSRHLEHITSYREPNNGKKYRLEKYRKKIGASPRGVPIWEIAIDIPPVKLMPEEEVLAHILMGASSLEGGFRAVTEDRLPPVVMYDSNEAWQCSFCAVQRQCHAYEAVNNSVKFEKHIKVKNESI